MVATFVIEVTLAVYVLWRYKLNPVTRLVALLLICLGTFQAAEFMVCRGMPGHALAWARVGYVAITLLPPLGLHLATVLAGVRQRVLIMSAYGAAAAFIVFFGFIGGALNGDACLGNYVIFNVAPGSGFLFGLYYYVWLAIGGVASWRMARDHPAARPALYSLVAGYLAFIIPTATVNFLSHDTLQGIPSIMCGFAVLLALVLAFRVLPAYTRTHSKGKKKRA